MATEYRVWHKPNPKYKGSYPAPDHKGLQGKFQHREKAEAAAESCKRYFNQEKYLEDVVHRDGSVTQEEKIDHHNNVIVWIDTYEDGVLQEAEKEVAVI